MINEMCIFSAHCYCCCVCSLHIHCMHCSCYCFKSPIVLCVSVCFLPVLPLFRRSSVKWEQRRGCASNAFVFLQYKCRKQICGVQKETINATKTNTKNRKEEAAKEERSSTLDFLYTVAKVLQQLQRQEVIALWRYICGVCYCCCSVTTTAIGWFCVFQTKWENELLPTANRCFVYFASLCCFLFSLDFVAVFWHRN